MKFLKEELLSEDGFSKQFNFDFSERKIEDALIQNISKTDVEFNVMLIGDDEILLKINFSTIINYLDARTLDPIKLNIKNEEEIPFSFNKKKSEELEIDFIEEELDADDLVFELILAQIPYNYSENNSDLILSEEHFYEEGKPFENLFKK